MYITTCNNIEFYFITIMSDSNSIITAKFNNQREYTLYFIYKLHRIRIALTILSLINYITRHSLHTFTRVLKCIFYVNYIIIKLYII